MAHWCATPLFYGQRGASEGFDLQEDSVPFLTGLSSKSGVRAQSLNAFRTVAPLPWVLTAIDAHVGDLLWS